MKPFLVTGCGRSGTAWAAHLFTDMGYPCGHEVVFSPWASGPLDRSDSSWLAVPHLPSLPADTPILRVMRDPYLVVQSIMTRGFLANLAGPFESYVSRYRPDIVGTSSHLGRAIRWVSKWDEPLDDLPCRLLRVEDGDVNMAPIIAAFHHAVDDQPADGELRLSLRKLGTKINTNPASLVGRVVPPSREQINAHPDGPLLVSRAERFGYGG